MSGLFNRLKSRKTGSTNTNNNENDSTSPCTFDEEGFLCPICHHKFNDHTELAEHYTQAHAQASVTESKDTNSTKNVTTQKEIQDPIREIVIWKQQFTASEESRIILSTELMQEKQHVGDLEEELELLKKQLRNAQVKVGEQSQEIGNLKAIKDVYDAQLAIFTNELLSTQNELKEKQRQITTLCDDLIPRSTNDDVDVLKRELVSVQHRMNEMAVEKEQQIEKLRSVLLENYQDTQKIENTFNQNVFLHEKIINENTSQIQSEINQIKQFVRLTYERKEKLETGIRRCLTKNQTQIEQLKQTNNQLHHDLEQRNESIEKLTNDLQTEQKQSNSSRKQIELLTNEIQHLEKTLEEIKQEKTQLIQTKMDGDQDDERQNLVRQITQEKDQYEQQTKELRTQLKQLHNERQQIRDECDNISKQLLQTTNEKNQIQNERIRLNNDIDSLKQQLNDGNKEKEQQINELLTTREQYTSINMKLENDLREANDYQNNQKQEIERLKNDFIEQRNRLEQEKIAVKQTIDQQEHQINETKLKLNTTEKEKDDIQQELKIKQQTIEELQTKFSQLHIELDQKRIYINRLSTGIRRAHKTHDYLQQKIHTSQIHLLTTIEQAEQASRLIRAQTLEQIREEFTNYLTIVYGIITDSKTKLEKQTEEDRSKLIEQQQDSEKKFKKIKNEHEKLIGEHREQKEIFEIQLSKLNNNLLKVSESLSEATQTADQQREKFEKQISSLERELESRNKIHEMQLLALKENLVTLRSELKTTHVKLASLEQIKAEKADIEARLAVSQDERHVLLERSLGSESKNDKLMFENNQLTKKNTDLEAALQEIAREYQGIQIQTNKINQRRWLNDDDIDGCMKCKQNFSVTQRKHHCRSCGNIFCDGCSSKTAVVAASSKKPQRVCDQCYKDLTS